MQFIYGTGNPAKIQSMADMLRGLPVEILSPIQAGLALPEVEESGNHPLVNARLKAQACYKAWQRPVFSCDSGLYLEGVDDSDQPGVRVRTVKGRRLNDEEMLAHYGALATRCGGTITARYHNAICMIDGQGTLHEACDESLRSARFGLCDVPHPKRVPGFPLDALAIELTSGKYYYDLEDAVWLNEECSEGQGFRKFFQSLF